MTTFFETTLFNSVFILVLIWFPVFIGYIGPKKNLLGKICGKVFPYLLAFWFVVGGTLLICDIFAFAWFSASDILDMSSKMHDMYTYGTDKENNRFYLFLLVLCVQGYIYFKIAKFSFNISGKKD
jgi:hypothetical protein